MNSTDKVFFTDKPLAHPMEAMQSDLTARNVLTSHWQGHAIVEINGHAVWKRLEDLTPEDACLFYDGDYLDVLPPGDPRISIRDVADAEISPLRVEWELL